MAGTGGGVDTPAAPVRGFQVLQDNVPLQATASGAWTDTPLEAALPGAGVYQLDAGVRCNLSGQSPLNSYIVVRLWDVTAGVVVPDSEMLVIQQIVTLNPATTSAGVGGNQNASLAVEYTVSGPATIRLQAQRTNAVGASTNANVISDGNGRTSLRFEQVA